MGIINKTNFQKMSYYYGYYDYYGGDSAPVEADEDMESDSMMMYKAAWGLATIGDLAAWSVNDDKWSAMVPLNPDWDNVMTSTAALGAFRLVALAGGMAVPAIHDMFMPIAGLTAVWEIANLYLVNKAEGAAPNTTSN